MNQHSIWLSVVSVSALAISAWAQESRPAFDVVSVKRTTTGDGGFSQPIPNGLNTHNLAVMYLITDAYDMPAHRVEGGPEWLRTERFDVSARADGPIDVALRQQMLRALLEDRFGLVTRTVSREGDRLALRTARADGRLGPGLERLGETCDSPEGQARVKGQAVPKVPAGARLSFLFCGPFSDVRRSISSGMRLDVDDRTGLTGVWGFSLFYAPDSLSAPENPDLLPFAQALEEQLGLKVERTRGPVEVLVIDSARRPTEN